MQFNGNEFSLHFVNIETRRDMLDVKNSKRVNVESLEGSFFVSISLLEFQTQIHANVRIAWRIRSVHDPDLNFKIKL